MQEYPKRLYRAGKGTTINSLEEEREFLTQPVMEKPVPPVREILATKKSEEASETTEEERREEALEYLVSKGYSNRAAKSILRNEGLEVILKHMAEGTDPQE